MRSRLAIALRWVVPALMAAVSLQAVAESPVRTIKVDCAAVLQKMRADFAAEPGRLLLALEDALTTSEPCVCFIVRNAVDLAGREPEMTAQILIAALRQLPASAVDITDCILLEAPAAAPAIRAALARELGEKAPALVLEQPAAAMQAELSPMSVEENPAGKQPTPAAPQVVAPPLVPENEFHPSVGISGIYIYSGSAAAALSSSLSNRLKKIQLTLFTTKRTLFRPVLPVTGSTPD